MSPTSNHRQLRSHALEAATVWPTPLAELASTARTFPPDVRMHKLFTPPVYPGAVLRQAILDRALQDNSLRVTVLQGPAGHGKSTTLQQIKTAHEARGWRTAWLTLDDADNDPRRFESHMRAVMGLLHGHAASPTASRTGTGDAPRDLADWMLDTLSGRVAPASIFIDEFQALRNEALLRFFRSVLARLPANVHVFIGSRVLPEIGLATLMVNRVATVVRADDLRFTPGEVDAVLRRLGQPARQRRRGGRHLPPHRGLAGRGAAVPAGAGEPGGAHGAGRRRRPRTARAGRVPGRQRDVAAAAAHAGVPAEDSAIAAPVGAAVYCRHRLRGTRRTCWSASSGPGCSCVRWTPTTAGSSTTACSPTYLAETLKRNGPDELRQVHEKAAQWYLAHGLPEEAIHPCAVLPELPAGGFHADRLVVASVGPRGADHAGALA